MDIIFSPLAEAEVADAFSWYDQPHINVADSFMRELRRSSEFVARNPTLYPRVEGEVRCAHLRRFPYSLYYLIKASHIYVLSCFHQHRNPRSRGSFLPLPD